ncbi:hypothetical protein ES288_D09G081200v1, partial [Gossypium darwinii]
LFQLSSRVGDKKTQTADIRHRLITFIVLCFSKNNSSQYLKRIRNSEELSPLDYLVLRMLALEMSDCPSPTLTAQLESRHLRHSTY